MKTNTKFYEYYQGYYENGDIANGVALLVNGASLDYDRNRLIASIRSDKVEFFKKICARSPELLSMPDNDTLQTPIISSCIHGSKSVLAEMLKMKEEGRNISFNFVDNSGGMSLTYAARYGHTEIVAMLLEHLSEEEINHKSGSGMTALMFAAKYEQMEVMELLLPHCTNIDDVAFDYKELKQQKIISDEGELELKRKGARRQEMMDYLEAAEKALEDLPQRTVLQFAEASGNERCVNLVKDYQSRRVEERDKEADDSEDRRSAAINPDLSEQSKLPEEQIREAAYSETPAAENILKQMTNVVIQNIRIR